MEPVVFISVDCLRADHVGCYGYDRPTTPNVDSFAEDATVFEHAYSNCPGTRWAFQSLHTGRSTHTIDGLGIPQGYRPLAMYFAENGYATGGFAVNAFVSRDYRYDAGFDTYYSVQDSSTEYGFIRRAGRRINNTLDNDVLREYLLSPIFHRLRDAKVDEDGQFQPAHSDVNTVDQALSFIKGHRDEPYFLWVHLMDAHTPYGYWPDHLEAVRGDTNVEHTIHPGDDGLITPGEEPPQRVIDTYDAGIRSADEQIGRLLDKIPDSATIVFTGDHGEEFGRFGQFHQASLYGTMTQVPLIVRGDDLEAGRSTIPAQHLDIPPTLLYAAGVDIPAEWEGEALQTADRNAEHPIYYTLGVDRVAVRTGDWKYINSEGNEELYHAPHSVMEEDPVEHDEKLAELSALVRKYQEKAGSVKGGRSELGDDNDLSDEVEDNLEDLGYI